MMRGPTVQPHLQAGSIRGRRKPGTVATKHQCRGQWLLATLLHGLRALVQPTPACRRQAAHANPSRSSATAEVVAGPARLARASTIRSVPATWASAVPLAAKAP